MYNIIIYSQYCKYNQCQNILKGTLRNNIIRILPAISNLKLASGIVYIKPYSIENGDRRIRMIGIWCGVRNNKLTGSLKGIECSGIWKLTILEGGINCVGRTCSVRISKNSKGDSINRIINNKVVNTIFYPLHSCCLASTSYCKRNLKEFSQKVAAYGLWNRYFISY